MVTSQLLNPAACSEETFASRIPGILLRRAATIRFQLLGIFARDLEGWLEALSFLGHLFDICHNRGNDWICRSLASFDDRLRGREPLLQNANGTCAKIRQRYQQTRQQWR